MRVPDSTKNPNLNLDNCNTERILQRIEDRDRFGTDLPIAAETKTLAKKAQTEAINAAAESISNAIKTAASQGKMNCTIYLSMNDIPLGADVKIGEWLDQHNYDVKVNRIYLQRNVYEFIVKWG